MTSGLSLAWTAANNARVELVWIDAEQVEKHGAERFLKGLDGLLVAPGFGSRGIEGKIAAIRYAREKKLPFFGICLGMQCAVIEFARDVLGFLHGVSFFWTFKLLPHMPTGPLNRAYPHEPIRGKLQPAIAWETNRGA